MNQATLNRPIFSDCDACLQESFGRNLQLQQSLHMNIIKLFKWPLLLNHADGAPMKKGYSEKLICDVCIVKLNDWLISAIIGARDLLINDSIGV